MEDGVFNPQFLEVIAIEDEILFEIGTRSEIKNFKSHSIYLSKDDGKKLSEWLQNNL